MASYYEQPQQFAPYIPEKNLEVFATALAKRDAEYNAGVEKIRALDETVSGLPVSNYEDKAYLKDLTSKYQTQIIDNAGADFSDPTLVDKFRRMATDIYKDPRVQQAITSTTTARNAQGVLEESKRTQKGYHIDNENYFNQQYSDWLKAPGGTPFNSTYVPYVDVTAEMLKIYKDAHPDQKIVEQYDGSVQAYAMKRGTWEAIDPLKVKQELEGFVKDNKSWQQQMGISSWNQFRGYTDNQLKTEVSKTYKMKFDEIERNLNTYQNMLDETDDPNKRGSIETSIRELKGQMEALPDALKDHQGAVTSNRDGVAAQLYTMNKLNTVASFVSYTKEGLEYKPNPFFQGYIAEQRLNLQNAAAKAKNQSLFPQFTPQGVGTEQQDTPYQSFINDIDQSNKDIDASVIDLMSKLTGDARTTGMLRNFTTTNADGSKNYNKTFAGKNATEVAANKQKAIQLYNKFYYEHMNGTLKDPKIKDHMEAAATTGELLKERNKKMAEVEGEWNEYVTERTKGDPAYAMADKIADADVPVYRRVSATDGRTYEIGKRDLSKGLALINTAFANIQTQGGGGFGGGIIGAGTIGSTGKNITATHADIIAEAKKRATDTLPASEVPGVHRAIELSAREYFQPLGGINKVLSGQADAGSVPGALNAEQKKIGNLFNLVKQASPDLIFETDRIGKEKMDFYNERLNKYINVNTYNSMTISNPGDKQEGEAIGKMMAIMNQKKAAFQFSGVPSGFKDDWGTAQEILKTPGLKNVLIEYHQPPGQAPYIEITGPKAGEEENSTGKIPLTVDEATKLHLHQSNETKLLDTKLALNRIKQEGTSVIERADNMRVGKLGQYFTTYSVENDSGAYRVTLRGTDQNGKAFVIPVDATNPFQNTQQIIYWVNSFLLANKESAAQLINKAILNNEEVARQQGPAGPAVVGAQPAISNDDAYNPYY